MPLTINLLHEEQYRLKQSKRDPLKLGLYALAGVAALFVMYYGYRLISSTTLNQQVKARQAEWARQEPAENAAVAEQKELTTKIAAADVINRRIENRFYWGPLLETLLKSVPANVQIVNFTGTNEPGNDHLSLTVEGIVAGDVPRLAADQFRTALADTLGKRYQNVITSFRSLEDANSSVAVNGKQTLTAHFTIEVAMARPSAVPPPAAAPERRKRP